MKILLTIDFPPEIGGIQKYLYERVKHLFTESDYIIVGTNGEFSKCPLQIPSKLIICKLFFSRYNKKWSLIPMFFKLLTIVWNKNDLTIEAGNVYSAIPVFILSLFYKNITYSVYCHGKELLCLDKKSIKSFLLRSVLIRAEKHYILSKFTATLLRRINITGEYITATHKIDLSEYSYSHIKSDPNLLNILTVGRLVSHKGHAILIDAVNQIPQSISWHLSIVGSGPEYNNLLDKINKYSLLESVSLKTNLSNEEVIKEYRNADLFVFPSIQNSYGIEGFGIALLEAMAFKIPIIASNSGGIPEVLGTNCGIYTSSGDSNAILKAILLLLDDSKLCEELVKNGFKRVKELFSWN